MATTLNAGTATGGAAISADTTGILALQSGSTPTTAVTVDASQNVGIGTSSPSTRLDVAAAVCQITGTSTTGTNPVLLRLNNTGGYFFAGRDNSTGSSFGTAYASLLWSNGAYPMIFGVNDSEQMRITSDGVLRFNSGYGSVATAYGCRAWVNFNGTGTVTIRASGNVSSITDNGTGDYTVNFTTAMPDANYACLGFGEAGGGAGNKGPYQATSSSSGARVFVYNSGGSLVDSALMNIAIFR